MDYYQKLFWIFGCSFGFLAVAAGAFGSHILKHKLSAEALNVFEVAVRYQMYHALGLLFLALGLRFFPSSLLVWAGGCFLVGTFIFSGSLYALVFSGIKKWGAITPVGGLLLLMGWLLALLSSFFL